MRRVLTLDDKLDVDVNLHSPEIDPETDGHYRCVYSISGLSKKVSGFGMGVDEIQATYLSMQLIGNILYTCAEFRESRLTWRYATEENDLGFPKGFSGG